MIISTAIYLKRNSEEKSSEKTIIKTVLKELRNEKESKELKDAQLRDVPI